MSEQQINKALRDREKAEYRRGASGHTNEPALLWSSLDEDRVTSVALGHMLNEVLAREALRAVWLRADDHAHLLQLIAAETLGLVLWTVHSEAQLPRICESLGDVRERSPQVICVVYAEQLYWKLLPSLFEAGAQLVAADVPSLQRGLEGVVRSAPRSQRGLHPLTSGLAERLEQYLAPAPHG